MCSKEKNRGLFEEAEWVGLKNEKKKKNEKKIQLLKALPHPYFVRESGIVLIVFPFYFYLFLFKNRATMISPL